MSPAKMRVRVEIGFARPDRFVRMKPSDSIGVAASIIEDLLGINYPITKEKHSIFISGGKDNMEMHSIFISGGKEVDLLDLDPSTTLADCGLASKNHPTLILCNKGPFIAKACPQHYFSEELGVHKIQVDSCLDTVDSFREKLHQCRLKAEGNFMRDVHTGRFILQYLGRTLCRGSTLLSHSVYSPIGLELHEHTWVIIKLVLPWMPLHQPTRERKRRCVVRRDETPGPLKIRSSTDWTITIDIANGGFRFPLKVRPEVTIAIIKSLVVYNYYSRNQKLSSETYIRDGNFFLYFNQSKLKEGPDTLEEHCIKDDDRVQVCRKDRFPVDIYNVDGVPYPVDIFNVNEVPYARIAVKCLNKIRRLKAKIEKRTGIPQEKQHLRFNGKSLVDDDRYLLDYGIVMPFNYDTLKQNPIIQLSIPHEETPPQPAKREKRAEDKLNKLLKKQYRGTKELLKKHKAEIKGLFVKKPETSSLDGHISLEPTEGIVPPAKKRKREETEEDEYACGLE